MSRNLGRMRHRVKVMAPSRVPDSGLGVIRGDQEIAEVWASVEIISSAEIFAYQQLQQRLTHTVMVRYDDRFRQGQFIRFDGRDLYIEVVIDPNEKKEFMKLICREGGNM